MKKRVILPAAILLSIVIVYAIARNVRDQCIVMSQENSGFKEVVYKSCVLENHSNTLNLVMFLGLVTFIVGGVTLNFKQVWLRWVIAFLISISFMLINMLWLKTFMAGPIG